jgi:hypothetical protein
MMHQAFIRAAKEKESDSLEDALARALRKSSKDWN